MGVRVYSGLGITHGLKFRHWSGFMPGLGFMLG